MSDPVDLDDGSPEADLAQEGLVLFAAPIAPIADDAAFRFVAARLVDRRAWIAKVEEWFAPLAQAADAAHKAITHRRAALVDEPKRQCAADAKALGEYEARVRRENEIAQARAQQEIAVAVETARRDGTPPAPIVAPPVALAPTPRAEGLTFVDEWYAEVTDLRKLAAAVGDGSVSTDAIAASMHFLNDAAKAQKSALTIPGVAARSRRVPRRTGR